ncbi:peptidyl-prolyl cis-trans isomerase-like 4-like protein [Leptotrombidium deliense]|uniref:Peptidyl-prolyl cis-trans isomerase n=1 Tax=Leptotrombidium deliense TaxID=299467 RepID=A0A443SS22_9ACAR|nr:peptidyl-prolyl cis-trans isomerase-like 4-like protein [Leptotrombidium deliense]
MSVVIETTVGDFTIDLFVEQRKRTTLNFLKLCKVKYYNFCSFFKIEKDFIAQTGDPSNTGRGGESVFRQLYGENARFFEAELKPKLTHDKVGTVSMVNNGESMHGSQFFITLTDNLNYLDSDHTVFGQVVEGLDVISKLNDTICDENHVPYRDIIITHTVILDDPFEDPTHLEIPPSPEISEELLNSNKIEIGEFIDENAGKTIEEIEEEIKEKEAKARAFVLEMVGDIPDADAKPPDNVLFVCKLNPVTKEEDLEIIFSRFGKILSCEVIKDHKTQESLQYAFIEFESPEDCEKAYFKMDNVLIDDRRIHVDFSQSVAKLKWKGKGKGVEILSDSPARDKRRDRDYSRKYSHSKSRYSRHRSPSPKRKREERRRRSRSPKRERRHHERKHSPHSRDKSSSHKSKEYSDSSKYRQRR